jgi:glycosyltransferase involved in cell wall biosynthesis
LGYGGIELVVHLLACGLRALGHEVTTFAVEGSDDDLQPVTLAPGHWAKDLGTPNHRIREATYQLRVNRELTRRAGNLDVVHLHTEFAGMADADLLDLPIPCLATVHSGIDEAVIDFLDEIDEDLHLVAISEAQKAQAPDIRWVAAVHNAVPIDQFEFQAAKDGYLLQLARINPDKGQHLAIEVAERTDRPLTLAGKLDPDPRSQRYFRELVEPRITGDIRWIENVGDGEKAGLLAGAAAMLFPIQWEEPFGLAMVEAMVSGTPVIAFKRGAAAELIEEGLTGFLVDSVDEMVERVGRLGEIDSEKCSKRARDRFSPARMAAGYEEVYRKTLEQSPASAQ